VPEALALDREGLLAWGCRERRDLPWRRTRDPWAVLVSEVMLQQTQVARVVPRYESFLRRFPSASGCAAAPLGDVIDEWRGLGYNRRAVNLHRSALVVVAEHGGHLPDDLDALLRLPGVGPYTARAVLAFAHERPVGVLDTNVGRVLARQAGRSLRPSEAQRTADGLVPENDTWAWNQAMLDLGATVCTAAAPGCDRCPVRGSCSWRSAGLPAPDPATGSAAVAGPQSPFDGSDRQGRGRLVDALRVSSLARRELAAAAGWPEAPERAERAAAGLVADGLAVWDGERLRLPRHPVDVAAP